MAPSIEFHYVFMLGVVLVSVIVLTVVMLSVIMLSVVMVSVIVLNVVAPAAIRVHIRTDSYEHSQA